MRKRSLQRFGWPEKRGFKMFRFHKFFSPLAVGAAVFAACATGASADGYEYEGNAMEAPKPAREFTYSFNIAGTSDYVFRGFSQTARDPTLQGGADVAWGSLYLGVWASGLDFGDDPVTGEGIANAEVDIYTPDDFSAVIRLEVGGEGNSYIRTRGIPVKATRMEQQILEGIAGNGEGLLEVRVEGLGDIMLRGPRPRVTEKGEG